MILSPRPAPTQPLSPQPQGTPWPTMGWPVAADAVDLGSIPAASSIGRTFSLVVVHKGEVVAEHYGPTSGVDVALTSWSMAKSVTHALVGIAVDEGRLSLDGPAPVPEWDTPGDARSPITIDQLLRMASGLEFIEDYVDGTTSHCIDMLFGTGQNDMGAYAAQRPPATAPDTQFNYSSGTTNLLCRILADTYGAGDAFSRWAHSVLFDRIGMNVHLDFDGAGTWVGSSFLKATARDFARFGLLYLRDGWWNGTQILPAGWVDYARTQRATDPDENGYGAHWWISDEARGSFHASGYEGQRIIVDPLSDTIIVRLGKSPIEFGPALDTWLQHVLSTVAAG